jgi:predicted nucleic acid-binding protein
MSFLLDTNVVSEWVKSQPNPGVVAWLAEADEDRVFISVVTLAEVRYGIERMPAGNRRKRLDDWLSNELQIRFEDRVLPIDSATAHAWGKLMARRQATGRPMSVTDCFIAATVEVHGFTLVTRNLADFEPTLKEIINPWT